MNNVSISKRVRGRFRRSFAKKVAITVIILIPLFFAFLYVVFMIGETDGGMVTIKVDDTNLIGKSIELSEESTFADPKSTIKGDGILHLSDTSYHFIQNEAFALGDGSNNGDKYICYSFYIKNSGDETLDYEYSISFPIVTNNLNSAVRVMLITSNEENVETSREIFAKAKEGTQTVAERIAYADELYDIPDYEEASVFVTDTLVAKETREALGPGQSDRYTIVLWLEGTDSECVDAVIDGTL
ncbi:MAG: hypothetical protein PHW21_07305, partial [Candidatus Izemoplasmatales bacterium]|nr:hypothetical protein [Candidatus Izemoplasmatales bacterium]